ncbi:uncharacterized protein LOC144477786, partial [Augochlora pura]
MPWKEVRDMVGDYDGSSRDVETWEKQIRQLVWTYRLSEQTAKTMVCQKLKSRALRWYHSRPDCVELTYDQLLCELRNMFGQRASILSLRREFERRIWMVEETFSDYVHDKLVLGNRVPISDNEIIDYIVDGIPDENLRSLARVQRFQTTGALLRAFSDMALPADYRRRRNVPHRREAAPSAEPTAKRDGVREREAPKAARDLTKIRCYNCAESGHYAVDCTRPRRERGACFRCGNPGHRVEQCPSSQNVNYMVPSSAEDDEFHPTLTLSVDGDSGRPKIKLRALIDSGSPISFVKSSLIPRECIVETCDSGRFAGINDSRLRILGLVKVTLILSHTPCIVELKVVPDGTMRDPLVLGRDYMKLAKITFAVNDEIREVMNIEAVSEPEGPVSQMQVNQALTKKIQERARELFKRKYLEPIRPDVPQTENTMRLVLTDAKPFNCSPRRLAFTEKERLREILDDLLSKGAIRESTSEYASPIVLTKKKSGDYRMCIDFRTLNKVTSRDNFPLPLIEDQLDLLEGKKYFTSLDLKDGFFHIKMHQDSVKYTSFVTPLGQYECLKMPFGLKGGPLKFQRYVTEIYRKLIEAGDVSVYMDDFLIATKTIEHHFEVLEQVFTLCVLNRLELRLDKCRFLETELEYLG